MAVLRNKLQGFQATFIEEERIMKVLEFLDDKRKSDYYRDVVMKDVAKQEKKMKG